MTLYHGSNSEVSQPRILPNLRALDFGAGFYLTSSKEQAQNWAKTVFRNRKSGKPILNIFTFDKVGSLKILKFDRPNAKWLDFVVSNRKNLAVKKYDLVIGPVANDTTLPVIDDYIAGVYTKSEAIRRLLPQNLTDQYAFLTDKSLAILKFEGSEQI